MTKDEIFDAILGKEGGYVNHPDDKGAQQTGESRKR
jgi:lysozyme family protein